MKIVSAIAGAVALVGLAGTAQAEAWYVSGGLGLNLTHEGDANGGNDSITYDLGYGLLAAVGFKAANGLRVEGEWSYRKNDVDEISGVPSGFEAGSWALMVNAFYDFRIQGNFTPYFGGGLGVAEVTFDNVGEYSDTEIALQIGAGAGFDLAPDLVMSVDYRLFGTDNIGLGAGSGLGGVEYLNSSFFVSLRKNF